MNRALTFLLLLPLTFAARADEASEAKLKEQLKSTLTQLRTLQTEKNAMMIAQSEMDAKNKALDKQVKDQGKRLEEMDKEMKDAKEKSEAKQAEQSAALTRLNEELARYKASLDKWQAAHVTITDIAKKKEVERAKFSAKAADLERTAADLRSRNSELFKLANEILTRYEQFGLGKALSAREPFTGNARVKLQNTVQDYNDKLLDQTAKP